MRLDKFFTHTGILSRREAARAAKAGQIHINGVPVYQTSIQIDPEKDTVSYNGTVIPYREYLYLMLNKPAGYVCATEDTADPTVLELLPEALRKRGLFPCGRLDKDTLGLVILTNDGEAAHRRLSPKHHAEKKYFFRCIAPLENTKEMEQGITLSDGYTTLPCKIELESDRSGLITLTEGKYHQIKRMFAAKENKIVYLERTCFAGIRLDPNLERGEWRELTPDEECLFTEH